MKILLQVIEYPREFVVGNTYNILYWHNAKLLEVRGKVTEITWSHVTIIVIEEG